MSEAADLLAVMRTWTRPVFVVIDGAVLAGAPELARKADVVVRSLFVEHRDAAMVQAGPWFAALDERHLAGLLRIEGIEEACVFWGGAVDEAAVFRHLRSVNLVDVPRPQDAPPDPFAADPETVLFRHWDPSVMALVLPVLNGAQRARLFGPLDYLALYSLDLGGAREAQRRADWPEATSGRLKFMQAQLDVIGGCMKTRSHGAISNYLRSAAPDVTGSMSDSSLAKFIAESEISGRRFGLETERGFGQWTYLLLLTHGKAASMPEITQTFADSEYVADVTVEHMLMAMVKVFAQRALNL